MFEWLGRAISKWLAAYLEKPTSRYDTNAVTPPNRLSAVLKPGDVLLVEGKTRISTAIKYLTQSTWSHAAIYVGDAIGEWGPNGAPLSLIEADLRQGVIAVELSKYYHSNTRICRPVRLSEGDQAALIGFLVDSLGGTYDLKNVFDLARYLLPRPPVPTRIRRRMLALGSGDPTRTICSTLIARAFQKIRYPILPNIESANEIHPGRRNFIADEVLKIRHHSLFAPRDFDLSPYFEIIKPTINAGFDYQDLTWYDQLPPGWPGPH